VSCGARGVTIPAGFLTDRCTVIRRSQAVVSQEVTASETVVGTDVPCRILSEVPSAFPSMFGALMQQSEHRCWFGKTPKVRNGDQLVLTDDDGDTVRYTVKDLQRVPAVHNWSVQTGTAVVDQTEAEE